VGGALGGVSSLGDPGIMLRKSPHMGISLHRGPFPPEEEPGMLGVHILGILIDE
jgi:hypothetical protein